MSPPPPPPPPMKYLSLSVILLSILCCSRCSQAASSPTIGRWSPTLCVPVSKNLHTLSSSTTTGELHHHHHHHHHQQRQHDRMGRPINFSAVHTIIPRGGGGDAGNGIEFLAWFRPGATDREKVLSLWLLFWNGIALTDALMFTFRPKQNLDGYHTEGWNDHTLAQVRMLANCQLALIGTSCLLALTSNETNLKRMFQILILATLGAFRAVGAGVKEGTIKAPWKTKYASLMTLPPLLLLGYFAFVY